MSILLNSIKKNLEKYLEAKLPSYIYDYLVVKYSHFVSKDKKQIYCLPYFYRREKSLKKYCIFRFDVKGYGLSAVVRNCIFAFDWAEERGYIPIVDIEYEYDFFRNILGENNPWEYIFEQISVKDVVKENWVLVKDLGNYRCWRESTCLYINGNKDDHLIHLVRSDSWREYFKRVHFCFRKFFSFKREIIDMICEEFSEIMEGKEKVLGVAIRENFTAVIGDKLKEKEVSKVLAKHPLTINTEDAIPIIEEKLIAWKCDKLFLSTDTEESLNLFKKTFGEKLLYLPRDRRNIKDYIILNSLFSAPPKEYYDTCKKMGYYDKIIDNEIAYAKEILLLSHCTSFVGAPSGSTILSMIFNGGIYENIYFLPDLNESNLY